MKSASVANSGSQLRTSKPETSWRKNYAPYQKQMLVALKWLDVYKYLFFVLLDGDFRPQSGEVVKAVGGSVTTIVERQVEEHIKWAPENFTDFLSTSATRTRKSSNEEGTHVL